MTIELFPGPIHTRPKGGRIDPGLIVVVTMAPEAYKEASSVQAILKFRLPNSLDYRFRYKPQFISLMIWLENKRFSDPVEMDTQCTAAR